MRARELYRLFREHPLDQKGRLVECLGRLFVEGFVVSLGILVVGRLVMGSGTLFVGGIVMESGRIFAVLDGRW